MPHPTITTADARLVAGNAPIRGPRRYRPLVAGLAILRHSRDAAGWTVDLANERLLRPWVPPRHAVVALLRSLAGSGMACRVAAVLADPLDAPEQRRDRLADAPDWPRRPLRIDIYGWALMYQPPGMRGRALVDADERFVGLPAVFELPLELLDRADFLESRGFRTRPLLIPTMRDDFVPGPDGGLRNRYVPDAALRPPCSLDRLL